ncbi:FHA domain-containing protein [Glycomyces salinus]|uniref:FHA domain-containing protein n=1 Tax=Glycomyces salinus TaxID=980294 RepID=UPI003559253C
MRRRRSTVENPDSTNGTIVDGAKIPPGNRAPYNDGDELRPALDVKSKVCSRQK